MDRECSDSHGCDRNSHQQFGVSYSRNWISGGALKIGSAILNPDVKLEDLKRTEVVISKGNKSVLENVGNLEGVVKMLQTEVKDSFKEIAIEMKQISLDVQEINNHVNEIFAVVTELHYKVFHFK